MTEFKSYFDPPPGTKWNVLNLGAGVQSSCLALMAAKGELTPMPDFAVFADTQAEPTEVYQWLDWLEKQLPFPVIRVTRGSLIDSTLKIRTKLKSIYSDSPLTYLKTNIPVFGLTKSGEVRNAMGRACTADFKVQPILKEIRKRCGIRHGQKEITVTQWLGISYDEMQRMKLPSNAWTQHRWPLVEKRMTRSHCKDWMKANGFPEPPRSACYFCPFHDNEEWLRLKEKDPVHFQKAVEFDRTYRKLQNENPGGLRIEVYLHKSCKPLDQVDLTDENKDQLGFDFASECEGMCGL
jgi:hypothetical protein